MSNKNKYTGAIVAIVVFLTNVSAFAATDVERGKVFYQQTCIACHKSDGTGALPSTPNFTIKKGPLSKTDAILIKHITEGFQSPGSPMAMPAKGGNPKLLEQDIKDIVSYLRKTFEK